MTLDEIRYSRTELTALCDYLQTVKPARFNYRHFVGENTAGEETFCPLGLAAQHTRWNDMGLQIQGISVVDNETGSTGTDAAMRIFGLDEMEAKYLFFPDCSESFSGLGQSPDGDATLSRVIEHVRRFIDQHRKDGQAS